ncbi:MAG: FAD-dependent monooxygenase [Thermoanaerobaculia bacterium]
MTSPSVRTRVLILGGGPAGSTAASLLARDGIEAL